MSNVPFKCQNRIPTPPACRLTRCEVGGDLRHGADLHAVDPPRQVSADHNCKSTKHPLALWQALRYQCHGSQHREDGKRSLVPQEGRP